MTDFPTYPLYFLLAGVIFLAFASMVQLTNSGMLRGVLRQSKKGGIQPGRILSLTSMVGVAGVLIGSVASGNANQPVWGLLGVAGSGSLLYLIEKFRRRKSPG